MSKEIKSKEDVLNQFPSSLIKGGGYPQYNYKDVLAAMEAYHSQFTDLWISVDSGKLPPETHTHYYWLYFKFNDSYEMGEYNYEDKRFEDKYGDELFGVSHWQTPAPPAKQ